MSAPIDKDRILQDANVTPEQFAETKLDWQCLSDIRAHHIDSTDALHKAGTYILQRLQSVPSVHSLRMRVKDPDHLITKIIRRKRENPDREFTVESYTTAITDLIGLRALHLFKNDWREIHDFIIITWGLQEKQVANIRDGDPSELRAAYEAAGFDVKEHPANYRSLHYLVTSQPDKQLRIAEIQVRTIFEEGWSEIDHRVRYPAHSSDPFLSRFLTIFNSLAGNADEMGTFVAGLSVHLKDQAARYLQMQSQLDEKEQQLQKAVDDLTINNGEKDKLHKQIKALKSSSTITIKNDDVSPLAMALLSSPFTSGVGLAGLDLSKITYSSDVASRAFAELKARLTDPSLGPSALSLCAKCNVIFQAPAGQHQPTCPACSAPPQKQE